MVSLSHPLLVVAAQSVSFHLSAAAGFASAGLNAGDPGGRESGPGGARCGDMAAATAAACYVLLGAVRDAATSSPIAGFVVVVVVLLRSVVQKVGVSSGRWRAGPRKEVG